MNPEKKLSIPKSLPIRFLNAAVILTELFIIGFGIFSYCAYHEFQVSKKHDYRIAELRGRILQLDEVLTMSARMAAATGSLDWEKRYKHFEPQLDAAIKETLRLAPAAENSIEGVKTTDGANLKLVEMEHQSFDLVRNGKAEEAEALLFSSEYEKYKSIYAEGMSQLVNRLNGQLNSQTKAQYRLLKIYMVIKLAMALFLGIVWILVLRAVRYWRDKLHEKTKALNDLNKTLDEKVRQRTEELELSKKMLLQSEKMAAVGQLAAGISHEINNPMGVILGFSQAVVSRLPPGDPLELPLKSIEREALRCKRLIQELLTFSRSGKSEKENIDINKAINEAMTLVLAQTRVKEIEIIKELAVNLPEVAANFNQIQQVVVNLATNAIDALSSGGKLIIRTYAIPNEKKWVFLEVRDTGRGIPIEIQSRIFEPFFTTKEVGKGTGLGLSLVYEIVQKHGGQIKLESIPDKGTLFLISLPVKG